MQSRMQIEGLLELGHFRIDLNEGDSFNGFSAGSLRRAKPSRELVEPAAILNHISDYPSNR